MVDISCLEEYIIDLVDKYYKSAEDDMNRLGLDEYINTNLNYLDCTRICSNGQRAMQTIGYVYAKNISQLVHIISNFSEDEKQDELFTKLLKRHNLNLEFEKTTPPEWYTKDGEQKFNKLKTKEDKPKKERKKRESKTPRKKGPSAAERRLAAKAAKINSLSINLPIKKV